MKVKIKSGNQNLELEVEPDMRMTLQDAEDVVVEFEKPLRINLSGAGSVNCDLPATIFTKSCSIRGQAELETEETIEGMKSKKVRGVQIKVLDAIEGEMTSEEVIEKTGLAKKQVLGAIQILIMKGLVERKEHKIRKVGTTHPDPKTQRNLEIPII